MPAILPGSWHGFEEKIGIFLVHVNVCVLAVWWCSVGRSLHTVAALNPQGTAHIHIQIRTLPGTHTQTHSIVLH